MIQEKFVAVIETWKRNSMSPTAFVGLIQRTIGEEKIKFFVSFPADFHFQPYAGKDIEISCISTTADSFIWAEDERLTIESRGEKESCGKSLEEILTPGDYIHFGVCGDGKISALFTTGCYKLMELYKLVKP